jgi:hypothetical protein
LAIGILWFAYSHFAIMLCQQPARLCITVADFAAVFAREMPFLTLLFWVFEYFVVSLHSK